MSVPRLAEPSSFHAGSLYVLLAALSLIALALFLIAINGGLMSWGGDNAMYLMHARNLVEGVAYNATGYIQNPNAYLAPQAYPPGFPLALVPVYALIGLDIGGLTVYATLIYGLAVAVFIGSIRRELVASRSSQWAWLALIPVIGCNPLLVRAATPLYSDGFFLLLLYAALWALQSVYTRREACVGTIIPALLTGILVGLCATTRIFGLLLIASIPVFELLRYRRPTQPGMISVATAVGIYAAITWLIDYDSVSLAGGSHKGYGHLFVADLVTHAAGLPATIVHSIRAYVYATSDFLVYAPPWMAPRSQVTDLSVRIAIISLLIGLVGYIACLIRRLAVREVFCAVYVLSLLPWMAHSDRYLLPVVPLLMFYIVVGLRVMTSRIRFVFPALLLAGFVICGTTYAGAYARGFAAFPQRAAEAPNGPAANALYDYIDRHTSPDAVFVFRKPRVLNLFTHRSAATYVDELNPMPSDAQMWALLHSIDADYLLVGPAVFKDGLAAFIGRHASRFELVYQNAQFKLYRWCHSDDR